MITKATTTSTRTSKRHKNIFITWNISQVTFKDDEKSLTDVIPHPYSYIHVSVNVKSTIK
jgi:hypothetical protein